MSKNIIIQEGGIGKQMTVSKLKTDLVGSGSCLWVPEDETTLATKSISQNGTYNASSDNAYGYSQVTVNVAGGNGSATSSGTPTTSNGVDPGGSGSSVIGKDTSGVISGTPGGDGNEYAVGIDEHGNIVATKVPSGIEIGKAPDKTTYTEGETIDYSGIIVILEGGDGAMFSNADYPNGRVPYNELIFPVNVAPSGGGGGIPGYEGDYQLKRNWVFPLSYVEHSGENIRQVLENGDDWVYSAPSGYAFRIQTGGTMVFCVASTSNESIRVISSTYNPSNPGYNIQIYKHTVTIKGSTYYLHYVLNRSHGDEGDVNLPNWGQDSVPDGTPGPTSPGATSAEDLLHLFFDNSAGIGGKADIPVQWKSRYDGRTFEDTFEITVTASGSGYSDDSGGSESGGGGNF